MAFGEYLIGHAAAGITVRRAGTITVARLQASEALAAASSIVVTITNIDTAASDTITISATEQMEEDTALSVAFAAGETLRAQITSVVGAPGIAQLAVELVRT